jgi:hypothetical protein
VATREDGEATAAIREDGEIREVIREEIKDGVVRVREATRASNLAQVDGHSARKRHSPQKRLDRLISAQ